VLENLSRDWTVPKMAKPSDLSIPHFQKLFKTHIGIAPIAFLRQMRLEKARELLENSFTQIKQIQIQTGMTNGSHFTRDFKTKYGMTPTAYRQQYWERTQEIG
jgi:transcriptional regulator GlxA family with amidase domain